MIKIDLITGFLGSGKTTFLRLYARHLMARGEKIAVLENDFGAVNVDMLLLQDLERAGCDLEMIAGGCDAETHRRRFRTKLISMGMLGYDRVLVEPSGIYDIDEFFDALYESPIDRWYTPGSVIAVVDAKLPETLSPGAEYLLASEAADAGTLLLSKSQLATGAQRTATLDRLNRALEACGCRRRFAPGEVVDTPWDALTPADLDRIAASGYCKESFAKTAAAQGQGFESLYYLGVQMDEKALRAAVRAMFADPACGEILRIKGFLPDGAGGWRELNATQNELSLTPAAAGQRVMIVIGEHLSRPAIAAYFGPAADEEDAGRDVQPAKE